MRRILIPLVLAMSGLGAGSGSPDVASSGTTSGRPIILDVRTPAEYGSGHLEGAQLIDFNAGDVLAAIPELDPEADYVLYCRSGYRSGEAAALLEQAGFTSVKNLGSLEEAAEATGVNIVE